MNKNNPNSEQAYGSCHFCWQPAPPHQVLSGICNKNQWLIIFSCRWNTCNLFINSFWSDESHADKTLVTICDLIIVPAYLRYLKEPSKGASWHTVHILVFSYVQVHACISTCAHVCTCLWKLGGKPRYHFPWIFGMDFFLGKDSHWTWGSSVQQSCVASEPQGYLCVLLSSVRIRSAYQHFWFSTWVLGVHLGYFFLS